MGSTKPVEISREEARRILVGHVGLRSDSPVEGAEGVRTLLRDLRCIQLDPLDRIGTNADLVALARVGGIGIGDVYNHLLPGHAFEHFAKERCLLPASGFPYYRERMAENYRFRWRGVLDLPGGLADEVLAEIEELGPLTSSGLTDRGKLKPPRDKWLHDAVPANSVALELLWTRCQVVVCGRTPTGKLYDVPHRALPDVWDDAPKMDFDRWALEERVGAAGLMAMNAGPQWTMIKDARTSDLPRRLVEEGVLDLVTIEGAKRKYLAPAGFAGRVFPDDDGRMRIVAPLDPLVWDRKLVEHVFGFDYVWEVYKPKAKRIWGYYVCPILHRGALVGRFEGRREDGRLAVENLWIEDGAEFDDDAWHETLSRHEAAMRFTS
jgi:uncharacterized protein YcaQ